MLTLAAPISTSTWESSGSSAMVMRPVHVAEAAADLGDHEMAAHELDGGVGTVDLVDARDGDLAVVVGAEHADCPFRHGSSSRIDLNLQANPGANIFPIT